MGKIAFVFSGQGAQYSGMGKSLYENSGIAKTVYDDAEKVRVGTLKQSFEGTEEELKKTVNTQPCIFLVDLVAALTLNENGIHADAVAGFSLGEIAALAYAHAYSYDDGFRIVCKRGELMQNASDSFDTAMAAVVKLDSKTIEDICGSINNLYPVNYNSEAQTVIAGSKAAIAEFKEKASELPCRIIDLPVSAAFHSPYMNDASAEFADVLSGFEIKTPEIPVYGNTHAVPYENNVKELMAGQINHPVKWVDTIENMISSGIDCFIEVGPGKTLSGLIKKISKDVSVFSVEDNESLLKTIEAVKGNA